MPVDLMIFFGAVVLSVFCMEKAVSGEKVQSRTGTALCCHAVIGTAVTAYLGAVRHGALVGFLVAWSGVFLSWFVIRSHIESSILLRMLLLVRKEPLAAEDIVGRYLARYGTRERLRELIGAGLLVFSHEEYRLTQKGRAVLKMVDFLS